MSTILVVDDDAAVRGAIARAVEHFGHVAEVADSASAAMQRLATGGVDLILSDYSMPGLSGIEFLDALKRAGITVPLVMLTGFASIEHAVAATRAGAVDFVTKPVDTRTLELTIERALEYTRLRRENRELRAEVSALRGTDEIIGISDELRRALNEISMAAPTRAPVLIVGERGTGKELLARALHAESEVRTGPFVRFDCGSQSGELLERALFGSETSGPRGTRDVVDGAIERARRGTLLLAQVGALPSDAQAKLLQLLRDHTYTRVGGSERVNAEVRIVATSTTRLDAAVEAGTFRRDLIQGLSVASIQVPALRDRQNDILLLATHFARLAADSQNRAFEGIAADALEWLRDRPWPGNVGEFKDAIERAVTRAREPEIQLHDFDGAPRRRSAAAAARAVTTTATGDVVLHSLNIADAERALIDAALARTNGNRTRAAELLGMSVRTLRAKLNSAGGAE